MQQVHEYVDKLWGIIDQQKEEKLRLKLQVQSLTAAHALAVSETENCTAPVPGQSLPQQHLTAVCTMPKNMHAWCCCTIAS